MAATVTQVLDGLVAALQSIEVRAYARPADITAAPCAFVLLEAVDYQNAFQMGNPRMEFTITVVASRTSDRNAYDRLSAAVGRCVLRLKRIARWVVSVRLCWCNGLTMFA
jgi:hypothetical protein